jgi:hypothetical protein
MLWSLVDLFCSLSRVRPFMCTPVTPAVPYLLLGLQDVQWAVRNSRGARKLARTPHVNQKKKIHIKHPLNKFLHAKTQ